MTREEFENYKFSNNTEIMIWDVDKFYKVLDVDFEREEIGFELGIAGLDAIKSIRG